MRETCKSISTFRQKIKVKRRNVADFSNMSLEKNHLSLQETFKHFEDRLKALEAKNEAILGNIAENSNHIKSILETVAQKNKTNINLSGNSSTFLNPVFQGEEENAQATQISGKRSATHSKHYL